MTGSDPYDPNPKGPRESEGPHNGGLPEYPQHPDGQHGYQPQGFPQQPGYPQPGYPQPGYPQSGYPYPGYGQSGFGAPMPTTRPSAVLAAAIVLIAVGGLLAALTAIGLFGSSLSVTGTAMDSGAITGIVIVIVQLVICVGAAAAGVLLLQKRTKQVAILATVVAGLLIVTCWGIVATIAVPILLWVPESSRRWFSA